MLGIWSAFLLAHLVYLHVRQSRRLKRFNDIHSLVSNFVSENPTYSLEYCDIMIDMSKDLKTSRYEQIIDKYYCLLYESFKYKIPSLIQEERSKRLKVILEG